MVVLALGSIDSGTNPRQSSPEPAKTPEEIRKDKIEEQFSAWDGSHKEITELIKASMNDPGSYEHVSTVYWDRGDHLIVKTTYRGTNAFGGVVTNTFEGRVDLQPTMEEIETRQKAQEEAARARAEEEARKAAAIEAARWRTWTDMTGGFSVEAEFGGYSAGVVTLKKPDGETVKVPMDRLSEGDQAWIRSRGR